MKRTFQPHPAIATLLLAATLSTLVAPLAEASHVRSRYKKAPVVREVRYSSPQRVTYVHRHHSDAAPLLAGIIGGFVLGAAIANSQPAVHASYSYWDPYCEASFSTLDGYRGHFRHHRHPRIVRVIEVSSGDYVQDLCWRNDGWSDYHGDWRHDGYRYR